MQAEDLDVGAPATPAPARRLWHNRDYMLLWSGQAVSLVGSQISQIAFPLLVLTLSKSPALTGIAAAVRMIPYLTLSLPAGALVDRWNRKRVMILCDAGRALALGSVPLALLFGRLTLAQLYIVALVEGAFFVFFSLSSTAALPQVVGREQLPAASAQNESSFHVSALIGPLIGGVLYGIARGVPFLVDAISYAASVVSLSFIRIPFQEERETAPRHLVAEITEGLTWLWHQSLVRMLAFLGAIVWIMFASIPLVVIVVARQHHLSAATIGGIFTIGAIGGLIGAILSGAARARLGFRLILLGAPWVMAAAWPLYMLAANPWTLGLVTAALFFVFPIYNVAQMSYRLALIPDHLQGRVNSVFRLISFTGQPLGMSLAGILIQSLGVNQTVLILLVSPIAMGLAALLSPAVRGATG